MDRIRILQLVICGAHQANEVLKIISVAQNEGWSVQVAATHSALAFVDTRQVEELVGQPIRTEQRTPQDPRPPRADALIVAPATFNTVNKIAQGIADNYATSIAAEAVGLRIPVIIAPSLNAALAAREPFLRSISSLKREGVRIVTSSHPSATGTEPGEEFPWSLVMQELRSLSG
ncbi:flavoprotein [Nocardia grenadensis]|uniref:flavoprotein n=1 Tax=Nocardia grenadensis TaxID=931537 RepID=UPI001472198D|nr:flavoprotein [Nocardia grenadensis]